MRLILKFASNHGIVNIVVDDAPYTSGTCAVCGERTLVKLSKGEYPLGIAPDYFLSCNECHYGCDCDDVQSELAAELLELRGKE